MLMQQIRRAACSACVLNPTAFYACINILLFLSRGDHEEEPAGQNLSCWGHVGIFFALGRLFFALGRLLGACWAFVALLGSVFLRVGSLRVRVWSVRAQIWNVQYLVFRCFVARTRVQGKKTPHVQKPQFFLGFCIVFTHRKFCTQAKKRHKIVPQTFRTKLLTKIA